MTEKERVILDVKGLTVCVPDGGPELVHDVTFQVSAGEMFGIVGESGSGKTMTLRALTRLFGFGFSPEIDGNVYYRNHDLLSLTARSLLQYRGREIGFVFQEPLTALNPGFSLIWHFREAIRAGGNRLRRQQVIDLSLSSLVEVGMPHPDRVLESFPHELSGGMRQRVVLALAMVNGPSLLLADEPTTALDVTLSADILELLSGLQERRRLAVVLVSHDLNLIAGRCRNVAIMHGGRIVEHGPAAQVLERPRHPYTMDLMASSVDPFASVEGSTDSPDRLSLSADSDVPESLDQSVHASSGCRYAPKCAYVEPGCWNTEPDMQPVVLGQRAACFRLAAIHEDLRSSR